MRSMAPLPDYANVALDTQLNEPLFIALCAVSLVAGIAAIAILAIVDRLNIFFIASGLICVSALTASAVMFVTQQTQLDNLTSNLKQNVKTKFDADVISAVPTTKEGVFQGSWYLLQFSNRSQGVYYIAFDPNTSEPSVKPSPVPPAAAELEKASGK